MTFIWICFTFVALHASTSPCHCGLGSKYLDCMAGVALRHFPTPLARIAPGGPQ